MKLKYYLRGLGIGIICTAIIMGIALSGNKKETMTDTEIIERARILGMVMLEEADASSNSDDGQQPDGQEPIPGNDKEEGSQGNTGSSPSESEDAGSDDKGDDGQEDQQTDDTVRLPSSVETDDDKGSVEIEIKAGEYSDIVCQKLFQAGLISDAAAFNSYLTQTGADQDLRVGIHQIPKGATQDEIIEILQK